MRAEKNVINARPLLRKLCFPPAGKVREIRCAVVTSPDAALVWSNDGQITRRLQFSASLENAVNESEFFRRVHIGVINVDHAVTIQKSSLFQCHFASAIVGSELTSW